LMFCKHDSIKPESRIYPTATDRIRLPLSSVCPVDHSCQFAAKSVHYFIRFQILLFTNLVMDEHRVEIVYMVRLGRCLPQGSRVSERRACHTRNNVMITGHFGNRLHWSTANIKSWPVQGKAITISAPWYIFGSLVRPLGRSPPECDTQCPGHTPVLVQNFNQIRSAVSEEVRPEHADRQT